MARRFSPRAHAARGPAATSGERCLPNRALLDGLDSREFGIAGHIEWHFDQWPHPSIVGL
jgi:hypothetical protein